MKRIMITIIAIDKSEDEGEKIEPYTRSELEDYLKEIPQLELVNVCLDDLTDDKNWNSFFEEHELDKIPNVGNIEL